MTRYVLDLEGRPVPCPDLMAWGSFFEQGDQRRVALAELPGGIRVSTVFLGLDHSWGHGPPVLWETMIFGGPEDDYCERYTSLDDAKFGHWVAVHLAKPTWRWRLREAMAKWRATS